MTTLNVEDFGAVGDGSTDDSGAIQEALETAKNGDTVYMPAPSDTYLVEGRFPIRLNASNIADNVTWTGDGRDTVVEYGGGNRTDQNTSVIRFECSGGISGWTCSQFVVDANAAAVAGDPNVANAIQIVDDDQADILFSNVLVDDAYGNGFSPNCHSTRFERCTAVNCRQHGFALDGVVGQPPLEVVECYAANNASKAGFYSYDISHGRVLLQDSVSDGSNYHGFKTNRYVETAIVRRCRFTNPAKRGYIRPAVDSELSAPADVTFEDLVFEGCGDGGPYLSQDTAYTLSGEIVLTGSLGGKMADWWVTDYSGAHQQASVDGSSAVVYISNSDCDGAFLDYDSVESSSLDTLADTANAGSLSTNGNLDIGARTGDSKTDLGNVPTASDVGAFSGDSTTDTTSDGFEDWTPRWASTMDDWGVVSGTAFEGDHAMEFATDGTDRTRYAISWDTVGEPADVEVLDRFRVPNFDSDSSWGYHARVHVRSYVSNGNHNGYWLEVEDPQDGFRLAKYTNGDLTTLRRFGTPAEDTFFYRRLRANGDDIKAKVWPASETEPASWDVEVTDTDHASGWVGVGTYDTEPFQTDVVSVGTGGESAPGPDAAPSLSWVNPLDGETVADTETVQVDANDPEDPVDTLTVEYRIDGGSWRSTAYNSETGYHEDAWDTTAVADGDHTLEARVTDSYGNTSSTVVSVTVTNTLSVATVSTETVTDSSATLVGEVQSLGGATEATCYFEWRESGSATWSVAGEQVLSATGQFSTDLTGLASASTYEFRAVAETDVTATGSTLSFDTGSSSTSLSIDRFALTDKSNPSWSWYEVDWAVSDADGALDTVVSELRYDGYTVVSESTNVSGETASFTHELRVKGDVDEVKLSVNDTSNDSISEQQDI